VTAENNDKLKISQYCFSGSGRPIISRFLLLTGLGVLESTPAKSVGLLYRKTFTFTPAFCDLKIKDHKMEFYLIKSFGEVIKKCPANVKLFARHQQLQVINYIFTPLIRVTDLRQNIKVTQEQYSQLFKESNSLLLPLFHPPKINLFPSNI
jgi:hypothetical protein